MKSKFLVISLFFVLIFYGCKKEENIPPVVEIFSPFSGQQYFQGDTIFYHFKVSDDEGVTNVKVAIANSSYQSITSRNYINAGKSKEYDGYFLTEGLATLGTTNHLIVTATDGNDETKAGREIIINQVPKITKGIYAITEANNLFDIYKIDTNYNQQHIISGSGDVLKMFISSKEQILYKSGKFTGDLTAYDLMANTEKWYEDANSVGGNPAFHNISLNDDLIFVSYDNESIKAYDKNKSIKFSVTAGISNYAVNVIKNKTIILTEEHSYPYIETKLTSYYFATGAPVKSKGIGQLKVVDFFIKDDYNYVVMGNEANQGKILYYNFTVNSVSTAYQIPAGDTIVDAEFIASENAILVQLVSGLYKFNLSNNNFLPILSGTDFEILKFDDARSELVTASGMVINFYTYPQLQLIQTVAAPSTVKALDVLYNR